MISCLSVFACLLKMTASYLVAQGKLKAVYLLGIVNGSTYTVLNVVIAANGSGQGFVLFLAIPSAWGVAMSVKGLRRLRRAA